MRFPLKAGFFIAISLLVLTVIFGARYREKSIESGYVAFNSGEYIKAREDLQFFAQMGDKRAQKLMMRMEGLGLGAQVDIAEAIRWMQRIAPHDVDSGKAIYEPASLIGQEAVKGLYGQEKVSLGKLWLQIAAFSE